MANGKEAGVRKTICPATVHGLSAAAAVMGRTRKTRQGQATAATAVTATSTTTRQFWPGSNIPEAHSCTGLSGAASAGWLVPASGHVCNKDEALAAGREGACLYSKTMVALPGAIGA